MEGTRERTIAIIVAAVLVALAIILIYLQDRGNDEVKVVEIEVALKNDTAPKGKVNNDRITSDPTILGRLVSREKVHKLQACFDEIESCKNITPLVQPNGKFLLDRMELAKIQGEPLKDGTYTLHLEAKDWDGKILSSVTYAFDLDITRPLVKLFQPRDGGITSRDRGFIDLHLIEASKIEPNKTLGATDLIIEDSNKALRSVTAKKTEGGLLRYFYDGELSEGLVKVTIAGGRFSDLAGNTNPQRTESFELSSSPPIFNGPPERDRFHQIEPVHNPVCEDETCTNSVYLHNGEVFLRRVDLEIPGRGFNWRFERTYRSGWQNYRTPLGRNWDFKDNRRLLVVASAPGANLITTSDCNQLFNLSDNIPENRCFSRDVIRIDGQGREDLYRRIAEPESPLPDGVINTFKAPPGFYSELTELENGVFVERDRFGTRTIYRKAFDLGSRRLMFSITDRNGNTMRFRYNAFGQLVGVMDTLGRVIDYSYEDERLVRVSDLGREIRFSYNRNGTKLEKVTGPRVIDTPQGNDFPKGKTEQYSYDDRVSLSILLHEVTAPNEVASDGKPREVYVYDDNERVIEHTVGGTNRNGVPAGGQYTYSYLNVGGGPITPGCPNNSQSSGNPDLEFPLGFCEFEFNLPATVVTDRNGNRTRYEFNPLGNGQIVGEFNNRNVRSSDPQSFITRQRFNGDGRRLIITRHEGNMAEIEFDGRNDDRLQQGNLRRVTRRPDPDRSGDQCEKSRPDRECKIVTTYTYEPIYNQRRTITEPRGNDRKFRSPILLPEEGFPNDRYTTTYTFDYQENTNLTAVYRGLAAQMEKTPDEVRKLLDDAGIPLGLNDVNGDGRIDQINGNVIRIEYPTVNLLTGSNQAKTEGDTTQEIVELFRYNDFGQLIRQTDPEGNVTINQYFSERDPDGDGNPNGVSGGNPATGGYLRSTLKDGLSHPDRNSETNPRPASIQNLYRYDPVGNMISEIDGRGIVTEYVVNQLNQVVQKVRAADRVILPIPSTPGADQFILLQGGPSASGALAEEFKYIERFWYDFNNNLVLQQKEDRGNTSGVDGNPPNNDSAVLSDPDPVGDGLAFADEVYKYDILDKRIENIQEVVNGGLLAKFLTTRYRYDPNQNLALTILPEGNANSSIYDERDLLFRMTRGAPGPESQLSLTLLGQNDPVDYDVRGGIQSRMSYQYDGNHNLVETVDAADTDLSADNNNPSLGRGDRTRHIYDGFDRRTSTVDSVGNQMVYQYDPAGNKFRELWFGPTGGPSPTSDGPDVLPGPVSINGEIQSNNLVNSNSNLLAATEYLHDELSRTFQTDQVLFVNSTRTSDVDDGASDLGKADLTPRDNQAIPGVVSDITIAGRVSTRTEFDRKSRSTFTVEDDGDTSQVFYDGADRMIKTVDPEGNTVEAAYDDNNNLVERREIDLAQGVTGEGGTLQTGQSTGNNGDRYLNDTNQTWRPFEWAGRTILITGGTGKDQVRKLIENTSNRLIIATNWEITPDDSSTYSILPIAALDHGLSSGHNSDETLNDETKTWTADEWKGRTVEITAGKGAGQVRTISGNNIIQLFVDPAWEQTPDDSSRFAIYSRPQPGIAEVFLTTNFYDLLDRLQIQTDNLGQTVRLRYGSRDNLVAGADAQGPAGGTINRRAFSDGPLTVNTTNHPGNVMRYFYDGINRTTRQETVLTASGSGDGNHIGASTEGIKNDPSAPESSIPPADTNQGGGNGIIRIGTTYDHNSLVSARIDDQGNVTLKLYNNLNRRVTESKGLTTGTGPLTKALILGDREIITPATPNIFTPAVIPLEKINAQLAAAKARIDGVRRLFPALADQIDDSPPTTIVYGYDQDDILVFMEDENDTEVWTRYDAINRPIAVRVFRAGQSDSHAGDPIFEPRQVNDTSNPSTDFPPVIGTTKQNYQFDGLSRPVRATDNNDPLDAADDSTVDFAYDSLSRIIEETQQIGPLFPHAISTGWRASNLRSSMTYPNGRAIAYSYDDLDRITTIGDDETTENLVAYNYIGPSRVLERRYPINGTRMTYLNDSGTLDIGYDGLRRQTELRNVRSDNTPIVGFAHTYDRMNNKRGEDKLHDPVNNETYEYDSQYRLTRFSRSDDAIQPQHRTWNLDGAGNWKNVNAEAETREHSSFNEITKRDVDGTQVALAYDDNGNLNDDSTNTYKWDFSNRLRTVTRKADEQIIARYTYDAPGRRVQKQISNSDLLNGTTAYYHDGLRVVEERDGADKVSQQYVYGNYIDEPLVLDRNRNLDTDDTATGLGDQRLFYHQNSLMNVYALTDTTGTIAEGYLYDAYGRSTVYQPGANGVVEFGGDDKIATAGESQIGNPYLFTGRRFDSESGLFYYRTRYFDTGLGRFISRDWIGDWGDATNLANGLAYVGNNSVNRTDFLGLQTCSSYPDGEVICVFGKAPDLCTNDPFSGRRRDFIGNCECDSTRGYAQNGTEAPFFPGGEAYPLCELTISVLAEPLYVGVPGGGPRSPKINKPKPKKKYDRRIPCEYVELQIEYFEIILDAYMWSLMHGKGIARRGVGDRGEGRYSSPDRVMFITLLESKGWHIRRAEKLVETGPYSRVPMELFAGTPMRIQDDLIHLRQQLPGCNPEDPKGFARTTSLRKNK